MNNLKDRGKTIYDKNGLNFNGYSLLINGNGDKIFMFDKSSNPAELFSIDSSAKSKSIRIPSLKNEECSKFG